MKCRDYQMLLIDDHQERIPEREIQELVQHIEICRECEAFRKQLDRLRQALEKNPVPGLPAEIDRMTRQRCLAELSRSEPVLRNEGIPRLLVGALLALFAVTLVLIFPVLGTISLEDSFTLAEVMAMVLILQNAVMLLLAPLLIRRYGTDPQRSILEVKNG